MAVYLILHGKWISQRYFIEKTKDSLMKLHFDQWQGNEKVKKTAIVKLQQFFIISLCWIDDFFNECPKEMFYN